MAYQAAKVGTESVGEVIKLKIHALKNMHQHKLNRRTAA